MLHTPHRYSSWGTRRPSLQPCSPAAQLVGLRHEAPQQPPSRRAAGRCGAGPVPAPAARRPCTDGPQLWCACLQSRSWFSVRWMHGCPPRTGSRQFVDWPDWAMPPPPPPPQTTLPRPCRSSTGCPAASQRSARTPTPAAPSGWVRSVKRARTRGRLIGAPSPHDQKISAARPPVPPRSLYCRVCAAMVAATVASTA